MKWKCDCGAVRGSIRTLQLIKAMGVSPAHAAEIAVISMMNPYGVCIAECCYPHLVVSCPCSDCVHVNHVEEYTERPGHKYQSVIADHADHAVQLLLCGKGCVLYAYLCGTMYCREHQHVSPATDECTTDRPSHDFALHE